MIIEAMNIRMLAKRARRLAVLVQYCTTNHTRSINQEMVNRIECRASSLKDSAEILNHKTARSCM